MGWPSGKLRRGREAPRRYLDGFEGNLTTKKWAILGKCSPASAQRDIADLVEKGVLQRNFGGSKNTSYALINYESEGRMSDPSGTPFLLLGNSLS